MANQDYDNRIYTEVINNGYSTDLANLLVSQANYETGGTVIMLLYWVIMLMAINM